MPYEIVGKTTYQHGKTLWEILGNLRNHGVGRIIVRNQFEKRCPEPSWYRVIQVQPLAPEGKVQVIPPLIDLGEVRRVNVLVDKVFNGKYVGQQWIGLGTYKPDFKLIPKEDEEIYTKVEKGQLPPRLVPTKIFPSHCSLPPLLKELVIRDLKASGRYTGEEPKMKFIIKEGLKVAQENETPSVQISQKCITETVCPSLYSTVKYK